jgi:hypothetical protein
MTAYNIFFRDERARMLKEQGATNQSGGSLFSAMGKSVAKRWKSLSENEKIKYYELAAEDTDRYRREMDLYNDLVAQRSKIEREKSREKAHESKTDALAVERDGVLASELPGLNFSAQLQQEYLLQSNPGLFPSFGSASFLPLQNPGLGLGLNPSLLSSTDPQLQLLQLQLQRQELQQQRLLDLANPGGAGNVLNYLRQQSILEERQALEALQQRLQIEQLLQFQQLRRPFQQEQDQRQQRQQQVPQNQFTSTFLRQLLSTNQQDDETNANQQK